MRRTLVRLHSGSLALGLLIATSSAAQEDAAKLWRDAEVEAQVQFQIDDKGRVCIRPDPRLELEAGRPLADPRNSEVWNNLGALGFLGFAVHGNTDLCSTADADRFFERLGTPDGELLQLIARRPGDAAPRWQTLRRLLAIRACEDRGYRPALGVLLDVAQGAEEPIEIRRAAAEAIGRLREGPAPFPGLTESPRPIPELEQVLANAPRDVAFLLTIDQRRIEPARVLGRWARLAGEYVTRSAIGEAGGSASPEQWAGAQSLACVPGLIGYEIARRYGNQRVYRTVLAAFPEGFPSEEPLVWARFDGDFDVEGIAAGLTDDGAAFERVEGGIEVAAFETAHFFIGPHHATVRLGLDAEFDTLGSERAAELAKSPTGAPIEMRLLDKEPLPSMVTALIPEVLGITPPSRASNWVLDITASYDNEETAKLVEGQARSSIRMLEQMIDNEELPEDFWPLIEKSRTARNGNVVTQSLDMSDIDFDALLVPLIEAASRM